MITIVFSITNFILLVSMVILIIRLYRIHRSAIEKVLYPDIAQKKLSRSILEKEMQKVRDGKMPSFIGLSLTQEEFDELVPYVKDKTYIENVLLTRGWKLQYHP